MKRISSKRKERVEEVEEEEVAEEEVEEEEVVEEEENGEEEEEGGEEEVAEDSSSSSESETSSPAGAGVGASKKKSFVKLPCLDDMTPEQEQLFKSGGEIPTELEDLHRRWKINVAQRAAHAKSEADDAAFEAWEAKMATFAPNARSPAKAAVITSMDVLPTWDKVSAARTSSFLIKMERWVKTGGSQHWTALVSIKKSGLMTFFAGKSVPYASRYAEWSNITICGVLRHYFPSWVDAKTHGDESLTWPERFENIKFEYTGELSTGVDPVICWVVELSSLYEDYKTTPKYLQNFHDIVKVCIRTIGNVNDRTTKTPRMAILRRLIEENPNPTAKTVWAWRDFDAFTTAVSRAAYSVHETIQKGVHVGMVLPPAKKAEATGTSHGQYSQQPRKFQGNSGSVKTDSGSLLKKRPYQDPNSLPKALTSGLAAVSLDSTKASGSERNCRSCGWNGHHESECNKIGQVGTNTDFSIEWRQSPQGQRYAVPDKMGLTKAAVRNVAEGRKPDDNGPPSRSFSGKSSQFKKGRFDPPRKGMLYVMNDNETKLQSTYGAVMSDIIISYGNHSLKLTALLDSGALQGNYGSSELMEKLLLAGFEPVDCSSVVCSCFGDCVKCLKKFNIFVTISDGDKYRTFPIVVEILPKLAQQQLIIGLPTLRKEKLIHILPTYLPSAVGPEEPRDLETSGVRSLGETQREPQSLSHLSPLSDQQRSVNVGYKLHGNTPTVGERYAMSEIFDSYEEQESDTLFLGSDEDDTEPVQGDGDLLNLIKFEGPPTLIAKARRLAEEYRDIFSLELGPQPASVPPLKLTVDEAKWRVKRNRLPARPISHQKSEVLKKYLDQMLEQGVIQPSGATEYSQTIMVPKKEPNDWRVVHDFRPLNEASEGVYWPLPNIKEMLVRLGSHKPKFFAVMDLTKGYNQFPMSADSKVYTAFITCFGIFEYNRVGMGLKGAGPWFQRMIVTVVLVGLILFICEVYLDDIITHSRTEDELIDRLRQIWTRFRKYNITVSPKKTVIGVSEIEYVGHVINSEGTRFSKEKIAKVLQVPPPRTAGELKSFVGLANYYREHIVHFAEIMRPLNELLRDYRPSRILKWSKEDETAFEKIKEAINELPMLFFIIDGVGEIRLYTDASNYAIGAYLCQVIDGVEKPVGFMSLLLNAQQIAKWSVPEKECFAIIMALKKFEYLIRDCRFVLYTDHKNLVFLNAGTGRVLRWKLLIQEHDCIWQYFEGVKNIPADGFSRIIVRPETLTEAIAASDDSVNKIEYLSLLYAPDPMTVAQRNLISERHNDVVGHSGYERTVQRLLSDQKSWRYMRQHVKLFIEQCDMCQKLSYVKPLIQVPKYTLASYAPMERIAMDTIGPLDKDAYGNCHVLVVIDLFTRFVELYAIRTTEAVEAARALLQHFGRYGAPATITSDRGPQFVNAVIASFLKLLGTEHTLSIAYSHQENGIVERANRTVMNALRPIILHRRMQAFWSDAIPIVQRIFNSMKNENTGLSPTQILFGNAINTERGLFATSNTSQHHDVITMTDWVERMLAAQSTILEIAQANQAKADLEHVEPSPKRARRPNMKPKEPIIEFPIGDYVLVGYPESAISGRRPPNKLMAQLKGPYKVVNSVGSAITIQNLVTNRLETVHISQLHPYNYDAAITDPRQVANVDHGVLDVEKIVTHKGNFKKSKASLSFKVRWVGQTPQEDSWEPWAALRNTEAMHKYLRDRGLQRHIPKSVLQPDEG